MAGKYMRLVRFRQMAKQFETRVGALTVNAELSGNRPALRPGFTCEIASSKDLVMLRNAFGKLRFSYPSFRYFLRHHGEGLVDAGFRGFECHSVFFTNRHPAGSGDRILVGGQEDELLGVFLTLVFDHLGHPLP